MRRENQKKVDGNRAGPMLSSCTAQLWIKSHLAESMESNRFTVRSYPVFMSIYAVFWA